MLSRFVCSRVAATARHVQRDAQQSAVRRDSHRSSQLARSAQRAHHDDHHARGSASSHSHHRYDACEFGQERALVAGSVGGGDASAATALLCGAGLLFAGLAFWPVSKDAKRNASAEHHIHLPVEQAQVTFAPDVPPPITRKHPVRLQVDMEAVIRTQQLDATHAYEMWTFNGSVPGPFVRARVGDVLDVTLLNTDSSGMQHNCDFHAITGPGGGAIYLTADYNETKSMCGKLLHPGLFVYHCAVAPVGWHIGNGMYGLILVEPENGLPPVDKEFYVMQGEFYTEEADASSNVLPPSYEKGYNETPDYVVFNGRVGSMVDGFGEPLKAKTGDRVRFFVGNGGPNLVSSFHIIGTVFDKTYREGDLISPPARSLQTTLIPAGGAAMIELDVPVPGVFTLVDHSIWRIEKGAVGFLKVEGAPRPDIFHSDEPARACKDCKLHP